jgi:serine/threonine-protein kinase RsbW
MNLAFFCKRPEAGVNGKIIFFLLYFNLMGNKENRIAIAFKSDLKYTELSVLVLGFIRKLLDIDDEVFFKIEISLREATNNAIIHGNGLDLNKRVHMEFIWEKSFVRIHVRDENNRQVNLQDVEDKIHNCQLLSFNGRGIMIIRSYMDSFEFHCRPGGSEVIMEKKLP